MLGRAGGNDTIENFLTLNVREDDVCDMLDALVEETWGDSRGVYGSLLRVQIPGSKKRLFPRGSPISSALTIGNRFSAASKERSIPSSSHGWFVDCNGCPGFLL